MDKIVNPFIRKNKSCELFSPEILITKLNHLNCNYKNISCKLFSVAILIAKIHQVKTSESYPLQK